MEPNPPPPPPPGWYPDPTGTIRWWDGWSWGPVANPGGGFSSSNTKVLAVVSHLGSLFGGFLLPLVIYLIADREDRYLRHHASEALNFQITFSLVWFVGFLLFFASTIGGAVLFGNGEGGGEAGLAAGIVLVWFVMMASMVASMVFGVIGAVRASQGVWWRYPVCIRFVRGAVDRPGPRP